jgi:hypothetical protein
MRANLPDGWTDVQGAANITGLTVTAVKARSDKNHPDRIPCTITEDKGRWGTQKRRRYLVADIEAWKETHS